MIQVILILTAFKKSYRNVGISFSVGSLIYVMFLVFDPPSTEKDLHFEGVFFTIITILIVIPIYVIGSVWWIEAYLQRRKSVLHKENGENLNG
ncbi:hypothetical protein BSK63_17425 [Paenibacillus odorifer]|nr:hypothetical protein BSK63_17425 [Paenibacillus odorifer]